MMIEPLDSQFISLDNDESPEQVILEYSVTAYSRNDI